MGWAGLPFDAVEVLDEPVFVRATEASGWHAGLVGEPGASVGVWVAVDAEAAAARLEGERALAGLVGRPSAVGTLPTADAVYGDGGRRLVLRDDNVVVAIERPGGGADDLARALVAELIEGDPSLSPPRTTLADGVLTVDGAWAAVRFHHPPVLDPFTLTPREVRLVPVGPQAVHVVGARRVEVEVFDRLGRSSTVTVLVE